jgi:hypothetical protein
LILWGQEKGSKVLIYARRKFGLKGIDPKAQLNLCDCAAYALAKALNAPLLFTGNNFLATDVHPSQPNGGGTPAHWRPVALMGSSSRTLIKKCGPPSSGKKMRDF